MNQMGLYLEKVLFGYVKKVKARFSKYLWETLRIFEI